MTAATDTPRFRSVGPLVFLLLPILALAWAYLPNLVELASTWQTNPHYSFGYLVPLFAVYLLWHRRDRLNPQAFRPTLAGLLLLLAGIGMRLGGTYYYYLWLDPFSLIPSLAGVWLMVGGWAAWRWGWPALLFLAFMIPLPYRLAHALSAPLQTMATIASTFVMQVLGLPALAEGNNILLNENSLAIEAACSGLSMLMVFFALSAGVAMLIKRPWLDRLILVASAIPIAIVVNIIRITLTGILYETVNGEVAHAFFHELAGWLMPPLALALLWAEFKVLNGLFLPAATPVRNSRALVPRRIPRVARKPA